ncbi:hypothetical protein MPSEU_000723800 [Mayamaea pseudoterrestris]|nr:hypothetical protein MPSEU_000723800 [Mayamaea pseudoterrestris]
MDASDQDGKRGYPWNVTAQNSRRRQQVGRLIHSIWTGDCGDAGLAAPYFDGRLDLLGLYQTFLVDQVLVDDDEGNNCFTFNEEGKAYFEVEREHCSTLTYEQFEQSYMRANQPVVIQGLARDWKASSDWVHQASDGTVEPNLLYLQQHFGNDLVDVFEQSQAGFSASRPIRRKMTITEYARWWEQHRVAGETQLIYMKDWKFLISHPKCGAYQCPHYFQEDWLNMATKNAYSFCYVGPRGTSTVLHADVLLSFSWSTNVCGRKKWFLVPPELTFLLYDCFGTKLATHLHSDVHDGMSCRFPGLRVARKHAYMLIQEAGETIFVPSKWFHTVQNLDACLSINHN